MTVDEIFTAVAGRCLSGLMLHNDMADYYAFLSLHGYKQMHKYHARKEMKAFGMIKRYYMSHYGKLMPELRAEQPKIIPDAWRQYKSEDVDIATKRDAVRNAMMGWVTWERETKKQMQEAYTALMDAGEVAGAQQVLCLVCDVDHELKKAERKLLDLKSSDFDMVYILEQQKKCHEKYKRK